MAYIVLTKDNFDQEVLRTEGTVLVDFWASWCGPCMALAPTIDEIAQRLGESREQIAASIESAAEVESLYRPINYNDEPGMCLMDRIPEESETQEKLLNKMTLKKLVSELESRDKDIILRRYYYNQTQSQVAKDLNISQVQVSRLEKKILKSMREKIV